MRDGDAQGHARTPFRARVIVNQGAGYWGKGAEVRVLRALRARPELDVHLSADKAQDRAESVNVRRYVRERSISARAKGRGGTPGGNSNLRTCLRKLTLATVAHAKDPLANIERGGVRTRSQRTERSRRSTRIPVPALRLVLPCKPECLCR